MELHRVRRRLTALAALTALTTTVLQLAGTAGAVEDVASERLAGQDRFETAAAIADAAFPDGSDTVLIASGRSFPDALAGAALGLPILLTEPDSLPAATAAAIDDLGAGDAIILGGTAAVSQDVEQAVAEHATVSRLAGDDRYETAAEIATSIASVGAVDGKDTAIIATGRDFADALAGGPLATGSTGSTALPILLVNGGVPAATSAALDQLGIEQVLILGGTAAVSNQVESDLEDQTGNPAVRLAGTNRYATAVDIAEFALDTLDFPGDEALLANGVVFADALAGGPLGGVLPAPLLLTPAESLADESAAFFADHADTIETLTTLGGTAAVSASTASEAESAAETPPDTRTNETITVSPTTNVNQANGSSREYTVTGVGTTSIDLVLVACNNVTTTSAGATRFANSNTNTVADGAKESGTAPDVASTAAAITSVNGTDMLADDPNRTNNDYEPNITPVNGSVTFEVSGPTGSSAASSCVVPVVFEDDNVDNALNVPATNPAAPAEAFGTGGSVTFSPSGQGAGQFNARNVQYVDRARDIFDTCPFVTQTPTEVVNDQSGCTELHYDANDTFQVSSTPITMAEFEGRLSPDDDISGTYSDVAASRSVFNLVDEAPTAPQNVAADTATSRGATVTWNESSTPSADSYRVYRAPKSTTASTPCPASTAGATLLNPAGVADESQDSYDPTQDYSYTDTSASPSTTYCYNVVAVDELDEGTPSDGAAITTTAGAAGGAPTITAATGSSSDPLLTAGDVHQLTFSEPMSAAATTASYTVSGTPSGSATITCSGASANALCVLSADATILRVTISGNPSPLPYPLTITAVTGMSDAGGTPLDLAASADKSIESTSLTGDTARPTIGTAHVTQGSAADNTTAWKEVGDLLDVAFSEAVRYTQPGTSVTKEQLTAILGTAVDFPTGSVTVSAPDASTLRFTVVTTLTDGVNLGETVPGTSNANVADTANNPEDAKATGPATLT